MGSVSTNGTSCSNVSSADIDFVGLLGTTLLLSMPVAEARLFYATVRGNYVEFPIRLTAETRDSAEAVLRQINNALRNGVFPAAPRKDACAHCEFVPVCGPYEEERIARKKQSPLRKLVELRGQP
jgi:hypothetical protein